MKKSIAILSVALLTALIILLFYTPVYVSAADNETTVSGENAQKNLAFTWLAKQVEDGWPQSAEDIAFTLLALTSDSKFREEGIKELLATGPGKDSSNVKDSALALFALDNAGEDTEDIAEWILTTKKKYRAYNLEWRMQLDSDVETSCDVSYGGKKDEVIINDDKTISLITSGSPRCLEVSENYFMEISSSINDGECLEKVYTVNCDDPVVGSIIYKKESILFVPSKTESGSVIELEIESSCLADGNSCDFESNLWAAYALYSTGDSYEIEDLLPYLVSQEDVEEDYLPYSFLYMITGNDDYAVRLLEQQEPKGFWYTLRYKKWFSTALAYLSLKESYETEENLTKTKIYILNGQNKEGSWEDVLRDTAFMSYVLWPSYYAGISVTKNACESAGYDCRSICDSKNEEEEEGYSNSCDENKVCCKKKEYSQECAINDDCSSYDCDGVSLPNGCTCEYGIETKCKDKCDNDADGMIDENDNDCKIPTCEAEGYFCCSECETGHQSAYDYSCSNAKCCSECEAEETEICDDEIDNDEDEAIDCDDNDCEFSTYCQKSSKMWLYLLIGIIIAAAGTYVYFNKKKGFRLMPFLKEKWAKFRKTKPSNPQSQYSFPSGQPMQRREIPRALGMMRRPMMKPQEKKRMTDTEKRLEETMKKIREMGKKKS